MRTLRSQESWPVLGSFLAQEQKPLIKEGQTMANRTFPIMEEKHMTKSLPQDLQAFVDTLRTFYNRQHAVIAPPVAVHLTGRSSRRRLGWYVASTMSIYVNEAGLTDYGVKSTLVHEYAHHAQHTCPLREGGQELERPGSSHGSNFQIHHWRLRSVAREKGLLPRLEEVDQDLGEAVNRIRGLRRRGGQHVIDTGQQLAMARERCRAIGECFNAFLEFEVLLHRTTAYDYIRAYEMGMPPDLNFTTMRFLMRIQDMTLQKAATDDAVAGVPLRILKVRYDKRTAEDVVAAGSPVREEEISALLRERDTLLRRLADIAGRLLALGYQVNKMAARRP